MQSIISILLMVVLQFVGSLLVVQYSLFINNVEMKKCQESGEKLYTISAFIAEVIGFTLMIILTILNVLVNY